MSAAIAIFVLLIFHVAMVTVGALNWDAPCSENLALFLIIYGGIGLLFVYILFREWLFYARLSSLPTATNLLLLVLFYVCLCAAGGFLTYATVVTRDECNLTAPLLYRWCSAAVLFFGCIVLLFLIVPLTRVLARLMLAPCALCLISCVETVGVDVEVGDAAQFADDGYGGGAGAGHGGGAGSGASGGGGAAARGGPAR